MSPLELLAGERQPREANRAVIACNDYLRMGPGRSLEKLLALYRQQTAYELPVKPPTLRAKTLAGWSSRYGWVARAETYDARMEAAKTVRAKEIMGSGLALAHERVLKLKELAELLEAGAREGDTKLVEQYRALLDDLAKETGGRKRQAEVNLAVRAAEEMSDDELLAIAAGSGTRAAEA